MRRAEHWLPGATMSNAQAHRLLDRAQSGIMVPDELIAAALIATGDLDNHLMDFEDDAADA